MGSRAWIVILCMGVGTVCLLGFITAYVVDSSPELRAVIRFKAALASDFAARGVRDVSLRRDSRAGGHELVVGLPRVEAGPDPAAFEEELAEYFLERFGGRAGRSLRVRLEEPGTLGCTAPREYRRVEVPLAELRARISDRQAAAALASKLAAAGSCRLVAHSRSGAELQLDVEPSGPQPPGARDAARAVEPLAREAFRGSLYATLLVRVVAAPEPSAPPETASGGAAGAPPRRVLLEVRFDRAGKELRP